MFRVSRVETPAGTTIAVDGQLVRESVALVEECCIREISAGRPVRLLLRDLTSIDQAGRALLGRLADKGVRLLAHGVYTTYLVEALQSGKGRPA